MITIQPSPLKLKAKLLNDLSIKTIADPDKESNKPYKVTIDFASNDAEEYVENMKNNFLHPVKMAINADRNKINGYSIKIEMLYVFELPPDKIAEQDIANFRIYTALSIAIADIRHYLATSTAHFQYGAYQLPYIDIIKLIQDKQKFLEKKQIKDQPSGS